MKQDNVGSDLTSRFRSKIEESGRVVVSLTDPGPFFYLTPYSSFFVLHVRSNEVTPLSSYRSWSRIWYTFERDEVPPCSVVQALIDGT